MLIRCPKCGIVYSYARNICHLCEDHSIFFGALFYDDRREYQWNCDKNLILKELKYNSICSKTKSSEKDAEMILKKRIEHKWNCICLSE
jgi:hypothetical protein